MGKKVGFTGTHKGASPSQLETLANALTILKERGFTEFHHGQCIGADTQAANIAKSLGYRVVAHPGLARDPANLLYRSEWDGNDEVREAKPFIARDHDIVDETEVMLAVPRTRDEEVRSGTWTTVRYAKKRGRSVEKGTLHMICPAFVPPAWARGN